MGKRLRIAFIGAGKVGCSLARYLGESEAADIVGFFSRSESSAREAAEFAGGEAFTALAEVAGAADVIFVTTPDGAIREVAGELAACSADLDEKIVVHCSGATSSEALAACRDAGALVASMHPLYAISSRFDCWQELGRAWFSLEGDDVAVRTLEALLDNLGNKHGRIDAAQKTRYHAAAVMASNLVVGLYDMAAGELARCGLDRAEAESALAALFLGNAQHIASDGVEASLTGPAARGDQATIDGHLACLDDRDQQVYELLTEELLEIAARRK